MPLSFYVSFILKFLITSVGCWGPHCHVLFIMQSVHFPSINSALSGICGCFSYFHFMTAQQSNTCKILLISLINEIPHALFILSSTF
jgi:hypothetical protein